MSHAEPLEKLQSLRNHGSKFGVERMRRLSELIGGPQRRLAAIHVAGTNGKGSTCAMIEAIQRAHGRTTGLYTSPHLVRLGERVQINRRPLSEKALLGYCEELFPLVDRMESEDAEMRPSFFELMTAMAFLAFAREPVDVAVIEVGLGGRLDATNILENPLVTVITSIGLDHTDLLGDSLEQIAAEKAGILKPGVPLALGLVPPEAEAVIRARAAEVGAPVWSVREIFKGLATELTDDTEAISGGDSSLSVNAVSSVAKSLKIPPETNLAGNHQRANAALALLACELAGIKNREARSGMREGAVALSNPESRVSILSFDEATARRALLKVDWAGRWQSFALPQGRRLILDVAHNEEGARALDGNLAALEGEGGGAKPHVIVGVLGLDRARPILEVVARHAACITLVRPENERACMLEELRACVPADFAGPVSFGAVARIFPGKGECALGAPGETVVVAGSVYLAGEVLSRFAEDKVCDEYARLQDRLETLKTARA